MRTLPLDRLRAAPRRQLLSNLRVGASTSFNEQEIVALDQILTTLMRGGDTRRLASGPIQALAKKVPAMKASIARQKERRDALAVKP